MVTPKEFGRRWAEIGFAVPAILIGIGLAIFPGDVTDLPVLIGGIAYALFIPFLFWYLAWQSGGVLRRSNFILGLGFLVLFAGRVIHSARVTLDTAGVLSLGAGGVLAPGLIIIALILITAGNEWGQTQ